MKAKPNLWPLGLGAVFVLFFAGMAGVVVIASTHREHLVSENYYEQELKFQSQIDGVRRAQTAGATIARDSAGGAIVISLPVGQLARKLSGTIELYRPADPKLDRQIALAPQSDGTQTVPVSSLAAGRWLVRVAWVADGKTYYMEQKIAL